MTKSEFGNVKALSTSFKSKRKSKMLLDVDVEGSAVSNLQRDCSQKMTKPLVLQGSGSNSLLLIFKLKLHSMFGFFLMIKSKLQPTKPVRSKYIMEVILDIIIQKHKIKKHQDFS